MIATQRTDNVNDELSLVFFIDRLPNSYVVLLISTTFGG